VEKIRTREIKRRKKRKRKAREKEIQGKSRTIILRRR